MKNINMSVKRVLPLLITSLLAVNSLPTVAAQQDKDVNLEKLKIELQQLKQDYQNKIKQLEQRLQDAEQVNEDTQSDVDQLAIDVSQQSNQKAANTFNPGIGVILNGRYASYNDSFVYQLPGFFLGEEIGPGEQGFNLGESELNLNANVDDKFYASATIAFGGDETAVEEAYIQTLSLGQGFNIKAGRFFSDIGYLAGKHSHTDDFANRPLPYEAFLAGHLGDAGIQATWLAPTELYWESGMEWYRGDSFPAAGASNHGKGAWTAFSHLGGDFDESQSWRAGFSYMHADVENRESDDGDAFSGTSKLWIADFIYKWTPFGSNRYQQLKLQGEYLSRNEQGMFSNQQLSDESLDRDQQGWYLESVYRFARQWRVGLRTSRLTSDQLPAIFSDTLLDAHDHSPTQHSLMLDWTNSEFSRIRLQLDDNNFDGQHENVWLLQYIAAFGAHGAHSF